MPVKNCDDSTSTASDDTSRRSALPSNARPPPSPCSAFAASSQVERFRMRTSPWSQRVLLLPLSELDPQLNACALPSHRPSAKPSSKQLRREDLGGTVTFVGCARLRGTNPKQSVISVAASHSANSIGVESAPPPRLGVGCGGSNGTKTRNCVRLSVGCGGSNGAKTRNCAAARSIDGLDGC